MSTLDAGLVTLLADTIRPLVRSEVRVIPGEAAVTLPVGVSKIGGMPDLPADFVWPDFEGERYVPDPPADFDDEGFREDEADRAPPGRIRAPLAFLAQIDCRRASAFDGENLLPKDGMLSFFYELNTMKSGFDPADRGCARVYWFPDVSALRRTPPPPETVWPDWMDRRPLPSVPVTFEARASVPCYDDFCETEEEGRILPRFPAGRFWEYYDEAARSLGWEEESADADRSKLLGWPDILNNPMFIDCEAVARGIGMTDESGMDRLTYEEKIALSRSARRDWTLLFQLGTVWDGDRSVYWGEAGHLFFWIRRKDLARRDFSRTWLIFQCG
ncbi:MAG: DUF1963 domain-containing protein [Clostridiales bacterium]|nr:DUF1963 domain-containing protein [Clostridiales bacterium]